MPTLSNFHFPSGLQYDRSNHMWVKSLPGSDEVTVGIDLLGLASLGDLAYVSLVEVGTAVKYAASIGTLEAAKMTGDILSPVSGVVSARNEEALRNPHLINEDPYGAGWLVRMEAHNLEEEAVNLVSGADLSPWIEGEIARYKAEGWID